MAISKSVGLFLKLVILGVLAGIILISLALVGSVISDRQTYRDQATQSISQSYAQQQRLLGPVLVQPYRETTKVEETDAKGVKSLVTHIEDSSYSIFPAQLKVTGELVPSIRRHGLYRVPVYEFRGTVSGHFEVPASTLKGEVQFGVPYLAMRVSDARGIVGTPAMTMNGQKYPVVGSTLTQVELDGPVREAVQWKANLRALLPEASGLKVAAGVASGIDFRLDLALAGTQAFELVPVGNSNHFELTSKWTGPLFSGQFLPRTREIGAQGFSAVWDVSSLASATQQQLTTDQNGSVDAISVSLADLIDPYSLAQRAVKYGILFVLLTFGGFFLFELWKRMQIHPVQYLLVGVCQAVFFLLLVSFSERMAFGAAYMWASVACIGLLTYYLVFVLKSAFYGVSFGGILAVLYAAIYGLLVSEDNALLLGSLLLFGVIALVMIVTRKVDWYAQTAELAKGPQPVEPAEKQAP
jgi:inner membrane protein